MGKKTKDSVNIIDLNTCLKIFFKEQGIVLSDSKRIHFLNIVHKYLCRTIEENKYEEERFEKMKQDNNQEEEDCCLDEPILHTGSFHPVEQYNHIEEEEDD